MRDAKPIVMAAIICLLNITAYAQPRNAYTSNVDVMYFYGCHKGHYVSIDCGLAMQKSEYQNPAQGSSPDSRTLAMPKARITYQWFFKKHFGIGAGIQASIFRVKDMSLDGYIQQEDRAIDMYGQPYQQRIYYRRFEESVKDCKIDIPIGLYWQRNLGVSFKLMCGAGLMASLLPSAQYTTSGALEATAYYQEYDLNIYGVDGKPNIYTSSGFSGKYKIDPMLSAFGEASLLYAVNAAIDISLGAVASGRLSSAIGKSQQVYNPDCLQASGYASQSYNGVLMSDIAPDFGKLGVCLQFGVRFRLGKTARMDVDLLRDIRNRGNVLGFNMRHRRRVNFDQVSHRIREIDSIRIEAEKRRQREIRELSMLNMKRIHDSIAKALADSTAKALAAADSIAEAETDKRYELLLKEITELTNTINRNSNYGFNTFKIENQVVMECIDRLAEIMRNNPDLKFLVCGHTCNIGSEEQNKRLGQQRAEAFKEELVKRGVLPSQLKCESRWFSEPLVPNTSEANRAKNRRIEITRGDMKWIIGNGTIKN